MTALPYPPPGRRPWSAPLRPMLGAVLDALAAPRSGDPLPSYWCDLPGVPTVVYDSSGDVVVIGSPYHSVRYPWLTTDPAEAWELLQARGLIPLGYEGRFVCEGCGGAGWTSTPTPLGDEASHPCYACERTGQRPHPPTVAALASWLSLGWTSSDDGRHPGILGAEELARAIVPDVAPLWRVRVLQQAPRVPRDASPADRLLRAGIEAVDIGCTRLTLALYVPPLGGRS